MEPLRRPNHSEIRKLREECRNLMARWGAAREQECPGFSVSGKSS